MAGGGAAVLQQHWRRSQQRNAHTLHYGRRAIVLDAVRRLPKHSADVNIAFTQELQQAGQVVNFALTAFSE